jgi:DNA polymerase-3 subunit epsilon
MIKILFDTETTGLLKPNAVHLDEQPEVVELYACMINEKYELIGEFDHMLKPKIPLTEELMKIHGITNDMLKDKPSFNDIFDDFAAFVTGADELIAHNLAFDRSMIANEMLRIDKLLNFPWPRIHTCTVEMSMPIEQRRLSLGNLHKYATGKTHEGAHRAKADVFALVRCYHWLKEREDD